MGLSDFLIDHPDVLDGSVLGVLLLEHCPEDAQRHVVQAIVPPELGCEPLPANKMLL